MPLTFNRDSKNTHEKDLRFRNSHLFDISFHSLFIPESHPLLYPPPIARYLHSHPSNAPPHDSTHHVPHVPDGPKDVSIPTISQSTPTTLKQNNHTTNPQPTTIPDHPKPCKHTHQGQRIVRDRTNNTAPSFFALYRIQNQVVAPNAMALYR